MTNRRRKRLGASIAGCLLAAATWTLFAPPQLGGHTRYVGIVGSSMHPHLHAGDLVLLRTESEYQSGDVVAYRSAVLGTTVLHRIVGHDDIGFITKGDNNTFQ